MLKKLFLLFILCFTAMLYAQQELPAIEGEDIRLPLMDAKGLKYFGFLYAEKGAISGYQLEDVIVDIFKENVDPSAVRDLSKATFYPIDAPRQHINDFWRENAHSNGIIKAKTITFSPNSRRLTTDSFINILSPAVDLEGEGLILDLNAKTLEIKGKVKTILRQDMFNQEVNNIQKNTKEKL